MIQTAMIQDNYGSN